MTCPNCSIENDNSLKYCMNCGTELNKPIIVENSIPKRKKYGKQLNKNTAILILIFAPSLILLLFIFLLVLILGLLG